MPYPVSFVMLAALFTAILVNARARKAVFSQPVAWLICGLFGLSLSVSLFYGNWLGAAVAFGLFTVLVAGVYFFEVMTRELFLTVIKWIFRLMPVVTAAAVVEFAVRYRLVKADGHKIRFMLRCAGFFFNPNYFGSVAAMTALICVYHFIVFRDKRKFSVPAGVCSLVCLMLSQSMFGVVELLAGGIVILVVTKRWKYLAVLAVCLFAAASVITLFPDIVPRLSESNETFSLRVTVWRVAWQAFRQTPFFGRGPLTYNHVYADFVGRIPGLKVWPTQHAHNILLDSLLSYGVAGTALISAIIALFAAKLKKAFSLSGDRMLCGLVTAVSVGVLVHGMVDITFLWTQTGLLFLLILSAAASPVKTDGENG